MTPQPDELAAPLRVVDGLLQQKASANMTEWGEKQHFVESLGLLDERNFAAIPSLNDVQVPGTLGPSTLVRYRGMVQDVFEPEMYSMFLEECDEATGSRRLVTSKYRECVYPSPGCALEEADGGLSERGVCYCVPLPGETPWVRNSTTDSAPEAVQAPAPQEPAVRGKRARDDEDVEMSAPDDKDDARAAKARVAAPAEAAQQSRPAADGRCKKIRNADEFGLNFPLPEEECRGRGSSTACIVKLYDSDLEALKVCHIVEVVGVLCVNHELANLADENSKPMEEDFFQNARQPSPSLVPRVHAVMVRHLGSYNPLLPFSSSWLSQERLASIYRAHFATPDALETARSLALGRLTCALGGDSLAALYMLLQLVSRTFANRGDRGLGNWSFNLTGWLDGSSVRDLAAAVAELVPRAVQLDVTAESLSKQKWLPKKDFVANRLVAGQLQLAPGTCLLLDETKLSEGQLQRDGVKALSAINDLVTSQKLHCDFSCYNVNVPLELTCVVVSRGRSIIKDVSVTLPIRPVAVPGYAPDTRPLDSSRMMLAILTSTPRPISIPADTEQQFARDFASARQQYQLPVEAGHSWLSLARAHALLHGEEELSVSRWSELMQLERERLQRCREDCATGP